MAVLQHLDISAFVRGSQRLNQEKAEINLVLNFLKPYFADLARRETTKMSETSEETVEYVFWIKDQEGNLLRYDAVDDPGKSYTLAYVDAGIPNLDHQLFRLEGNYNVSNYNPIAETLAVEDVGPCHGLLTPLLAKMVELYPENLSHRLKTFYDASTR